MQGLTEEKLHLNYLQYMRLLQKYNCYSESMATKMGDLIEKAPYSKTTDYGGCYMGGMIDVTLTHLCPIGIAINSLAFGPDKDGNYRHPLLCVNEDKLKRVLLLINLGKAILFEPEEDQWKIKRGMLYRFRETGTVLKVGARTCYLLQKYNVPLDDVEYEAILQADNDDEPGDFFRNPLFHIVKTALRFTDLETKQEIINQKNTISNGEEK